MPDTPSTQPREPPRDDAEPPRRAAWLPCCVTALLDAASGPEEAAKRRRAVNALPVSSAILPEDRERMLDLPKDDDASLIGKRGPHLWRRGDPAEERRKAQRRGRADKCR